MRNYYIEDDSGALRTPTNLSGLDPSEPAILQVERALRSIRRDINFESLLHAIETLEPYVASRTLLRDLAEVKPILTAFTDPSPRHDALMNWRLLWTMRWEVIRCVRRRVSDGVSNADEAYLEQARSFLLQLREAFVVDAFNLNYDDLFEREYDWVDGYDPTTECAEFDRSAYAAARSRGDHIMSHLHGSIHFGYAPAEARRPDGKGPPREVVRYRDCSSAQASLHSPPTPTYTDDAIDDAAPIVSGANKVMKFTTAPYSYYYAALQQAAQTNDRFLFLGYGFADPHVNNWVLEAIQHHGSENVRAAVIDYKPPNRNALWRLPATRGFSYLQSRLGAPTLSLHGPRAREFVSEGRLALSSGGFPARRDIAQSIIEFLKD